MPKRMLSLPVRDNSRLYASTRGTKPAGATWRVTYPRRRWNPAWGVPPWNQPTTR